MSAGAPPPLLPNALRESNHYSCVRSPPEPPSSIRTIPTPAPRCPADYEPDAPACALGKDGVVTCVTDEEFISITRALRQALPRPAILTSALWSVGAYGEGAFTEAPPSNCPHTGVALTMLRTVGRDLDQVHVMAYAAGDEYDAKVAYDAYRAVYSGERD